ncbi:SusC/RagA family TonB-linked outer membrane protein [Longitalea luteola]|uniref:SusC/RagA family TonB-linked outer membrane protein n=1 Tax=Longitalea luteola TaxID=2812563 RepID=UPI001A959785|nr:TonB-dependent receptor [Longitalea luteola]
MRSSSLIRQLLLSTTLVIHTLFLSGLPAGAFAQNNAPAKVEGQVLDDKDAPLPGVNVMIKGARSGVATSADGSFSIEVPEGNATLVFSSVGYVTREIAVKGATKNLSIRLQSSSNTLNDVVVIGYGTQKKVNLTGSVENISSARLADRPVTQLSAALQGVAPGVTVTTSTGAPGSDAGTIRIRGIGTLNNANALVLIDGIEGNMNELDPNMIESISVLKDAASSAIYGSRAANGVILVTTKRAKGEKLTITYNGYMGKQTPTNLPDKVDALDHMRLLNLAYKNTGLTPVFTDAQIEKYSQEMYNNPDEYPNTDWQEEVLKGSGMMQNHSVGISGSSGKLRFLTSLGYLKQDGIIKTSSYERYTLRNNADVKFNDKVSMKLDLQLINRNTVEPGRGMTNVFSQMNRIPATQLGRLTNGKWGEGWNGNNPIAMVEDGGFQKNNTLSMQGNLQFTYKPVHWLTADLVAAPRFVNAYDDNFVKAVTTYTGAGSVAFTQPAKSEKTNSNARSYYGNYRANVTADKDFGEHSIKWMVGASKETYYYTDFTAFRDNYLFPDYTVINAGDKSNQQTTGSATEWSLQSFFSRLNYNFKGKYLLEANARYDGSSRFSKGNKYGFFPSFSAGWRISEEHFMENLRGVLTDLKFRASWGTLGNQNIGTNYGFVSSIALGSYAQNGQVVSLGALNDMSNAAITWETTTMTNVGVDVVLLKNLSITADWYRKITDDILLTLDIPLYIGLNAPVQNAGKVSNVGWELGINYNGRAGKDFTYGVNFNISDVKNKVLDLKGISASSLLQSREGHSINSIYGLEADGYFQSQDEIDNHAAQVGVLAPGDIKYVNQNKDNIINDEDYKIIGSTIPRFTYGLNLNAAYKGFSFNAFLQGVGKANGYLYSYAIQPFYSGGTAHETHKDYWTEENPNAQFPRLTYNDGGNNYQPSSFWMKNAAYLRLKNIQLAYSLPISLISKWGVNNVKVYVGGQNLLTRDKFWKGYDVETAVGTGNAYPQVKVYTVGLDIKF